MSKSLFWTQRNQIIFTEILFSSDFFPRLFCLSLPRARSLHYALFLSYRVFLTFFLWWYNLGTRCTCCPGIIGYNQGLNHSRGWKSKILPVSRLSSWTAIGTIFRDTTFGDIMMFLWELHHSWISWRSPFTDPHIQVNRELLTTDDIRVHSPFPFSLLPPSHFYIPKAIQKSKQDSCHCWHQHPPPMSCLHSSQRSHLARGCPRGPASAHVAPHGVSCVIPSSPGTFTFIIANDLKIIVIKLI